MFYILFSNYIPPTEIYTLSLHDALPISLPGTPVITNTSPMGGISSGNYLTWGYDTTNQTSKLFSLQRRFFTDSTNAFIDRKSTRLNSSHTVISYAVFCLKKKI